MYHGVIMFDQSNVSTVYVLMSALFFVAAFLYSSVGHGGASAYLALMALMGVATQTARPAALIMNTLVSIIAFLNFRSQSTLRVSLFVWLAAASIPMSFIGARISLSNVAYQYLLSAVLLIASLRLLMRGVNSTSLQTKEAPVFALVGLGAVIGLLSGMLGIGGGVLLSPALIFLRWASPRESALISALFIFVNSLSGLTSILPQASSWSTELPLVWMSLSVAGGLLGAFIGSKRFSNAVLSRVLGLVMLIASLKIFIG